MHNQAGAIAGALAVAGHEGGLRRLCRGPRSRLGQRTPEALFRHPYLQALHICDTGL